MISDDDLPLLFLLPPAFAAAAAAPAAAAAARAAAFFFFAALAAACCAATLPSRSARLCSATRSVKGIARSEPTLESQTSISVRLYLPGRGGASNWTSKRAPCSAAAAAAPALEACGSA